ncbi:MAG TPA: alpha/beta hydrolase [Candidatus Dormibacteraeota bacterium]
MAALGGPHSQGPGEQGPGGLALRSVSATARADDGRQVGYEVWGDPASGLAVIVHCHGSPGSRLPTYPVDMPDGFVHVALDRPGYGLSDPKPGRRMADHADDVARVLAELEVERFSVFGWSGGTGPALSLAARLPQRVRRVVVGGGRSPVDSEVFEPQVREEILGNPDKNREDCEQFARDFVSNPERFLDGMSERLPPQDREAFEALRPRFRASWSEGFRQGGEGFFEDDMQLASPWGFDLADVRCEVQLWHGEADAMVPVAHGRWLAERLPRCTAHVVAGESHGSLQRLLPEMCAWLAASA